MSELLTTKSFWTGVLKIVVALLVGFGAIGGVDVTLDPSQTATVNVLSQVIAFVLGFWGLDTINKRHTVIKERDLQGRNRG